MALTPTRRRRVSPSPDPNQVAEGEDRERVNEEVGHS